MPVMELLCKYSVFTWLLDVSCVCVVLLTIRWLQEKQTEGKESGDELLFSKCLWVVKWQWLRQKIEKDQEPGDV